MLLTSRAVQGRIHLSRGEVKSVMKRFVFAIAALFALGWSSAFAQATSITTTCPTNFTCAFSAAETLSLVSPSGTKPGSPDVYVGYLAFDNSGNVTMTGTQNIDGIVNPIGLGSPAVLSSSEPCAAGASGQPATITFTDKSQISFVRDMGGTELQFILSKDQNTPPNSTANIKTNSVRVGVCRQQ
jgi:hypothetical protein